MSADKGRIVRQWVSLPGGSCDVRVGAGVIDAMGGIIKGAVGRPRTCALVTGDDASAEIVEQVRRQLTDAGFKVSEVSLAALEQPRTLEGCEKLSEALLACGVTADDLVCAVGDVDLLSLASHVAIAWCGGTPLVQVPTTCTAALVAGPTPLGIDVGGMSEMLTTRPATKHAICDPEVWDLSSDSDDVLMMRALMATSAICDSEPAVQRLWDRADLLVAGEVETLCEQLGDTCKSRGHVASSTSVAIRQSLPLGQTFMRAAARLVGADVPQGLLLAEGVRFQARIAAAMEICSVDDVLTMDELFDMLELEPVVCDVDPEALVEALRQERFARTGRFLLNLPRGLGRVRPSSVDEDLLLEHASAWCATRAAE